MPLIWEVAVFLMACAFALLIYWIGPYRDPTDKRSAPSLIGKTPPSPGDRSSRGIERSLRPRMEGLHGLPDVYLPPPPNPFTVRLVDLVEQMSISSIEESAIVFDPMGAAPKLPFGHLNQRWQQFKDGLQTQDEVWSFAAVDTTGWDKGKTLRTGYVAVSGYSIGSYFLTRLAYVRYENLKEER